MDLPLASEKDAAKKCPPSLNDLQIQALILNEFHQPLIDCRA